MNQSDGTTTQESLTKLAALSIAAAVITLCLKFGAYFLTGSVGLLSDAVESTANLVAAVVALGALWYAARPIDRTHNYGHGKIEFFAGGLEGILIIVAAVSIAYYAIVRLITPQPVESVGIGLIVAIVAGVINLAVGMVLLRVGRTRRSLALEADGRHLLTDVITTVGVIIGVALVWLTDVKRLDPIVALLVTLNIFHTGYELLRAAVDGLLDRALPIDEEEALRAAIARQIEPGETFHALRTRQAGQHKFVDLHLLVPGGQSVQRAHEITLRIERAVAATVPGAETTVHIEPIEDPTSWGDSEMVPLEPKPPVVEADDGPAPSNRVA